MPLDWIEGWNDRVSHQKGWSFGSGATLESPTGLAAGLNPAGDWVLRLPTVAQRPSIRGCTPDPTVTFGFWWYTVNYPSSNFDSDNSRHWVEFRYNSGASRGPTFQYRNDGGIDAFRANNTKVVGTSPGVMKQRTAHYVEFRVFVSSTVGTMECWVDGVKVIDESGLDTEVNASYPNIDAVGIDGLQGGVISGTNHNCDDLYVGTGSGFTALGPIVVRTLFPDGNGAHSDWAGSDGNSVDNYLLVDENPHDGDTTYVSSGTDTDRESYTFDDLNAADDSVIGVEACVMARYDGGADNIQVSTRISSTDYDGATQAVPASYGPIIELWEDSPATASAWTVSEVNGAEFGFENVT